MWEQKETLLSLLCGKKQKGKNWYYRMNKDENYIISLVWSTDCWQVCISDKETLFTHRICEKDLDIAKLKGLLKAKQVGWNIRSIQLCG